METACSMNQLVCAVLSLVITPEQCREAIEKAHEFPCLLRCTFHIHSFQNRLVKHLNTTLYLVKNDGQIQA